MTFACFVSWRWLFGFIQSKNDGIHPLVPGDWMCVLLGKAGTKWVECCVHIHAKTPQQLDIENSRLNRMLIRQNCKVEKLTTPPHTHACTYAHTSTYTHTVFLSCIKNTCDMYDSGIQTFEPSLLLQCCVLWWDSHCAIYGGILKQVWRYPYPMKRILKPVKSYFSFKFCFKYILKYMCIDSL